MNICAEFVRNTWTSVVLGGFGMPPGAPVLKFDTINRRREYADSIVFGSSLDMPGAGQYRRLIIATAKIGQETDQGKPPWDMKPMLLNGPKARLSKKGIVYNIIPFRHGVPSGGNQSNAHFRTMPQDVHAAARTLRPSIGTGQLVVSWGGRLSRKNPNHQELLNKYMPQSKMVAAYINGATKLVKNTHAAGIYDNMVKVSAPYSKTNQSRYMTFRVVSENSPQFSWWHPGRNAQPHVKWVADYCRPKIEERLKAAATQDLIPLVTFRVGITVGVA